MPAQGRSGEQHLLKGKIGRCPRPAGPPGEKDDGDEQAKACQEIKGFLGWLESFIGAKVEGLTPKTKLQSYYEHDYDGFLAVLKKNRKKLAVDPAHLEPWQQAEFEGSLRKLAPLRQRSERTDGLIEGSAAVRADGRDSNGLS